jgi:hypothetical protein
MVSGVALVAAMLVALSVITMSSMHVMAMIFASGGRMLVVLDCAMVAMVSCLMMVGHSLPAILLPGIFGQLSTPCLWPPVDIVNFGGQHQKSTINVSYLASDANWAAPSTCHYARNTNPAHIYPGNLAPAQVVNRANS